MAKAKGTKAAAKANRKDAKPAPKAAPAKPASKAAKPAAKGAAKPAAKGAAKPAAKAAKPVAEAAKPSKPPVTSVKPEALAASVDPTSEGFIIKKKKVKRGAPPMLPRRVPRRALPPLEAGAVLPPPKPTTPGSLHAPARSPEGAERLKANLTRAINALQRLKALKRNIQRQFWDAALTLHELSQPDLYQAKGYGSWESFLEREVERELGIGRVQAMDLVRIVKIFQRDAAEEIGLEKLRKALREIYPEQGSQSPAPTTGASG
jgi:hypothetical protein